MRIPAFSSTLVLLLLAGTAVAQEHQHPSGQNAGNRGMGMMMQGMSDEEMAVMTGSPSIILRLRDPLGLTPQQVQRLMALQQSSQKEHDQHMEAAMRAMSEADSLLDSDAPDLARYEAALRRAADHHVLAHLALARAGTEARQVLTSEQRSNLRFGLRVIRVMMPAGMGSPSGEAPPPSAP